MTTPNFPYTGSQALCSADRLVFHSKKDGIFLFGKSTVGISSIGSVNVDAKEEVKIYSPTIKLGDENKVVTGYQRVILGDIFTGYLEDFLKSVKAAAVVMKNSNGATPETIATSFAQISSAGIDLEIKCDYFIKNLDDILSDTTYTV